MLAIKSQWLGRRRGAAAVDVSHQPRAFAALPARLQRAGHYSARPLRVRAAAAEQDAATETPDQFKDELGELAVKIEQVAKSVDEGLKSVVSGSAVLQGTSIFLLGMMGSGKTTTGRMLGNVLKYCFFDSDAVIEQAVGGATVADIFRENGEDSFRDMEKAVLQELCTYKNCIVATGGGVVVRPENWGSLQVGVTVYLEGSPELLAKRVLAQDNAASRPLLAAEDGGAPGEEATREKLEGLLRQRGASYANADCTVGLDGSGELGASAPQMCLRVLSAIDEKIKQSAAEREENKKFTIKHDDIAKDNQPPSAA